MFSLQLLIILLDNILGSGGFSSASAVQQDDPIVESVSGVEHLTSTLIIAGGEGYIDFRSGKYLIIDIFIIEKEELLENMFKMFFLQLMGKKQMMQLAICSLGLCCLELFNRTNAKKLFLKNPSNIKMVFIIIGPYLQL